MDNMNYEDIVKYLADELSFNYLTVSFGEVQKDGYRIAGIDNEETIMETVFSKSFYERVMGENGRGLERCRNILVIGSGTTFDSYTAIPLGNQTKDKLIKHLGLKNLLASNDNLNKKFLEEAERLYTLRRGKMPIIDTPIYEDSTFDFENFLLLLTKFFPEKKIREEIQRLFNVRHAPCFTYEIIAHLFKHGFIDIIVNFNFDELLDQAIEEEMGIGNYHTIISDGQCKDLDEIMVDGRLKIPVYVKPHGTASHKSTLRFTKEHYFDLPQDIYDLLRELFSGKVNNNKEKVQEVNFDDCITRVNILSVGFNLDSIEFNHILEKHLPDNSRLFAAIYKIPPEIFSNENMAKKCTTNGYRNIIDFSLLEEQNVIEPELPFSAKLFLDLFERIQSNFEGIYKPRGIMRHELVHKLFYDPTRRLRIPNEDFDKAHKALIKAHSNSSFFKEKVIFEFALALARGREIIEIKELMNDRLGLSYELYRKHFEKENPDGTPVSLFEIANIFKLKEYFSFSRNVHNLTRLQRKELKNNGRLAAVLGIEVLEDAISATFAETVLFRILSSAKTPESLKLKFKNNNRLWDEDKIKKIKETLSEINKQGNYLDINPRFYDRRLFIFDHYYKDQILHTNLSLTYRENEALESPKYWDYCLAVSDTGKFLDKDLDWAASNANHIYLIACMEAVKGSDDCTKFLNIKELRDKHKEKFKFIKDRLTVRLLPYNDHSHHMLIFLKKTPDTGIYELSKFPTIQISRSKPKGKENFICVRSIYFYTRGFSKKINPMWIKGAFAFLRNKDTVSPRNFRPKLLVEDHKMLLETFYAYHIKAETYEKSNGEFYKMLFPKDIKPKKKYKSREFNVEELFDFLEKEKKASNNALNANPPQNPPAEA
jgi:hypothetical protein